jgi:hypothetical protein
VAAAVTGGRQRPFRFRLLRYVLRVGDMDHRVDYEPGESTTSLFGGNSNWRGPIWFPINYLLVECPTGSGRLLTLGEVARELSGRLASLFLPDAQGRRPSHGDDRRCAADPPAPVPEELVQAILKARVTTR